MPAALAFCQFDIDRQLGNELFIITVKTDGLKEDVALWTDDEFCRDAANT